MLLRQEAGEQEPDEVPSLRAGAQAPDEEEGIATFRLEEDLAVRTIYIGKLRQHSKVRTNEGNVAISFILEAGGEAFDNFFDEIHTGEFMIIQQTANEMEVEHAETMAKVSKAARGGKS